MTPVLTMFRSETNAPIALSLFPPGGERVAAGRERGSKDSSYGPVL